MALAVGASVVLALVGAPIMVVPNPSSEGARRERINRGLVSHCASNAPAIFAALDVMRKRAVAKWDDRDSETW